MSIHRIAELANVSSATVSRVLNNSPKVKPETYERVKAVIDAQHYVPNNSARNLRIGRSQLLGIIVSDITNPFFAEIVDTFEDRARSQGIDVLFNHTGYQPARLELCMRRLISRNVDGIAICTSESNAVAFAQGARHRLPLVLMGQGSGKSLYDNVNVDHHTGALQAIKHLHDLGHRQIAFIAGPREFWSTQNRREAFLAAMAKFRLRVRDEWIVEGELRTEGGHDAMEYLLAASPPPTAVLTTNDLMALGALQAAHQHGISVPEELSIIGFDNLPVCEMVSPPLTSVDIPRRDIALKAFRLLTEGAHTARTHPPVNERVATRLVVRESTGRVRRKR
jgi:DNA-binding LacI/PurR family transcriptional regulator